MHTPHPARRTRLRSARPSGLAFVLAAVVLMAFPLAAHAQGFRVFRDGNGFSFWDPSYGAAATGSALEVVSGSKLPVDYVTKWRGTSAIRLRWTNAAAGSWVAGVAAPGWPAFNANPLDSLVFFAYSTTAIPASELPRVLVEDFYNRRSVGQSMAAYNPAGVPAGVWTRVVMPLGPIKASPGSADMTLVNKAFFEQNPSAVNGVQRTMWIDELRFVAADATPPATPAHPGGNSWERHVDVTWDGAGIPSDVESYRVERLTNGAWSGVTWADAKDGGAMVWLGAPGVACTLRVVAEDWSFRESAPGPEFSLASHVLSDAGFFDMVQRYTFRYFWEFAHPVSGLIRERTSSCDVCASGGTGFGLMCIPVGVERGWISRAQGTARTLQVLGFLANTAERHWGAYPHWIHGVTGQHVGFLGPNDDTMDLVETAYLAQAFLTLRQYFTGTGADEVQIRALCTQLWQDVDWAAFRPNLSNTLSWHRSPTTGLSGSVTGWNEAMIVYLLAVASPTHPVPAVCYTSGWARNGAMVQNGTFYGRRLYVGPGYGGPMFFAHYSFLGFDPRAKRDAYANYFTHNRNQALVQISYAVANPFARFDYGANSWGLTASDDPNGYAVHAPYSNDNGTLTPTAALASAPYVPQQSLAAARHFYETWATYLWTFRGFKDAFNLDLGWFASDEIAIDQGPIVCMIENMRSGLLWDRFMRNPEIAPALSAIGFVADSTALTDAPASGAPRALRMSATPNPTTGPVLVEFEQPETGEVMLEVFDLSGRRVSALHPGRMSAGRHALDWNGRDELGRAAAPGVYLARLTAGAHVATARVVRVR